MAPGPIGADPPGPIGDLDIRAVGSTMEPRAPSAPLTREWHHLVTFWLLACNPASLDSSRASGLHGLANEDASDLTANSFRCILPAQVEPGGRLFSGGSGVGDCTGWSRPGDPPTHESFWHNPRRGSRKLSSPRKKGEKERARAENRCLLGPA